MGPSPYLQGLGFELWLLQLSRARLQQRRQLRLLQYSFRVCPVVRGYSIQEDVSPRERAHLARFILRRRFGEGDKGASLAPSILGRRFGEGSKRARGASGYARVWRALFLGARFVEGSK